MAIAFDAQAVSTHYGVASNAATFTCGITVGAGANNLTYVDIIVENAGSQNFAPNTTTAPVVTVTPTGGGTPVNLTSMGWVLFNNAVNGGWAWRFVGAGVPAGPQTVSATITDSGHTMAAAFIVATTYTGVASVGALATAYGTFTPAVSVGSAAGHVVSCLFGSYNTAAPWSSPSFTAETTQNSVGTPFILGDTPGSTTVALSATHSAGYPWGAYGNDMLPAASGTVITPGAASLVLTGPAPTVTITANKVITPGAGSLVLTGSAPTVSATANKVITPGAASLVLTGPAPTVTITANKTVTPGAGSLVLTGSAPTVSVTANKFITPGAASLVLTGPAPTVTVTGNVTITPGAATLTLTGSTATVQVGGNKSIVPGVATLALTGPAPTVTITANKVITPGAAALALTGSAPTVSVTGNVTITPGAASLTLTGPAPTVFATANKVITPGAASLTLIGLAPTVSVTGNRTITPGAASLILTGPAPTVTISAPTTYFVDYGYAQSELCWGASSPDPIDRATVTRICQGIKAVGGSRVRIGVQVGSQDDLDFAINTASDNGLKVLLCILGNPVFGYTSGAASYGDECKFLAKRYGPSGTNQVTEYELWNESNNAFNGPQTNAANFMPYLKAGYTAIHSVHSSAVVMPGGTVPTTMIWFGWAEDPVQWYTDLYAAGAKDFMDALAMHLYCDLPALPTPDMRQWKYMTDVRALMIANGDAAKKIWITEVGTSNPGPGITTSVQERDYLKAMVDGILSYDWMGPFFIYSFENTGANTQDSLASNYGIVTHIDCIPKEPKYSYCLSISSMAANPLDRTPPSAPTGLTVTTDGLATWLPSTDDVGVTVYRIYDYVTNVMLCHTADIGQTSIYIPGTTPGAHTVVYATALDAAGNESAPSATAEFTPSSMPGAQQAFTANFALLPSVPLDFGQIGWGFHDVSGLAIPNIPTAEGDWYTIAPYYKDLQTPDAWCEITIGAASAHDDRYAMAGCRVSPDGKQGVFGFISGGGQDDAAQIITIDGGVVTIREARDTTPLLPGQALRITPHGNVYTLERYVNGVATELVSWADTSGVYTGTTNHRAAPAWRHKLVGGIYYPPDGIATWRAADTNPVSTIGSGGTETWTYAIIKPGKLGRVIATGLWETAI